MRAELRSNAIVFDQPLNPRRNLEQPQAEWKGWATVRLSRSAGLGREADRRAARTAAGEGAGDAVQKIGRETNIIARASIKDTTISCAASKFLNRSPGLVELSPSGKMSRHCNRVPTL
jgi:hypothetical protein